MNGRGEDARGLGSVARAGVSKMSGPIVSG
jgi:hypothetical protein